MTDKNVSEHSFRKKDQIITMGDRSCVKIKNEVVQIDTQLLFQRLITAGRRLENLDIIFQYELCSFPPSMFENKHSHRRAQKATLANAMWKLMPMNTGVVPATGRCEMCACP